MSLGILKRELRFLLALRVLPPNVALFQWRARKVAFRLGEEFTLRSSTRPKDLATLIGWAQSRRSVVELGTGTGLTTISLALAACAPVPHGRRARPQA